MTIFLDEAAVSGLVGMDDALSATEEVFREAGNGTAVNVPRIRVPLNDGTLRITAAVLRYRGFYGVKVSSTTVFGKNAGRVFCLYKEDGGELCAIVQVFAMGALRTGAATGVATKYLANENAETLCVIGSGRQAKTQVDAISRVRALKTIRAFSPKADNLRAFCDDLRARLGIEVVAAGSAEQAVAAADIVVTATTSKNPVLLGEWVTPGAHINAIGANYEFRRELDSAAVERANFIATDDREQVQYESTDLKAPVAEGLLNWDKVHALGDVVAGKVKGRAAASDVTIYKSLGIAIEDVALAVRVYERAKQKGIGVTLPNLSG